MRRFFLGGGPLENLFKSGLTLLALLALAILANITCAAQDWLWFSREFTAVPNRVVVHHNGQHDEFQPDDTGYAQLAGAIVSSLESGVARRSGIGLSTTTLDEVFNNSVSVEAFFDQPVKLHAPFRTGQPTQMLFLMTGRHSDLNLVFLGEGGEYRYGSPELRTTQPIRDALKALGYLH